jgi:hypothetical protein
MGIDSTQDWKRMLRFCARDFYDSSTMAHMDDWRHLGNRASKVPLREVSCRRKQYVKYRSRFVEHGTGSSVNKPVTPREHTMRLLGKCHSRL